MLLSRNHGLRVPERSINSGDVDGRAGVERVRAHRLFFARLVTANAGSPESTAGLLAAFSKIPREQFLGPGPWKVFTGTSFVETPSNDPAFLYQDILIAIAPERHINNGEPSLHAVCLTALNIAEGETIIHIGAGTGYYTAILAELVGKSGSVLAYEIEQDLAQRAAKNLSAWSNVSVCPRSGSQGTLPSCDAIYVNAGATGPLDIWLDALRPNGRLLFPLTPKDRASGLPGGGGTLLVTRRGAAGYSARFVCPATFIPCFGGRDEEAALKLTEAFARGDQQDVRSLWRGTSPDSTCWYSGTGWWLSSSDDIK
jgi:protein-L-isoaspartate(D-aspartate) O-methyltransferase